MTRTQIVFSWLCTVLVLAFSAGAAGQAESSDEVLLPAFPGAEGFGAGTPGGRGGTVHYVTTLEDYLPGQEDPVPGSLRAAVAAKGPRLVLFAVGGTISLKADLWVREPCITIAGQTAPGGGICVKDYQFVLATHDIIVRHVRFRSGDLTRKEQMSVGIFGGNHCILDHCSMSWAIDEVMSAFGAFNFTAQWCIIAEGLSHSFHPKGEHSKGSILDGTGGISIHHSLYAHNAARNPRVNTVVLDFRNNVLYNWGYRAAYTTEAPSYVNWIANYHKPGPSTRKNAQTNIFDPGDDMPRIHLADNVLEGHEEETRDNARMISPPDKDSADAFRARMAIHLPYDCPPVHTDTAGEALARVLAEAGATLPRRDSADLRLMEEVETGAGRIIDSPAQVGGWPELAAGEAAPDKDQDGMPDAWEEAHRFSADDASDGSADADGDGYTNVEEFLNGTNPGVAEGSSGIASSVFREQLAAARRQSASGFELFRLRRAGEEEAERQRDARQAESLKITFTPDPSSHPDRIVVDLNGAAVLELVRIEAGSFLMGTPESEGGLDRERPQHKVNISRPFYFANTKTTTAQLVAVFGPDSRALTADNADLPAKEVNWFDAVAYCALLSKVTGHTFRLPTEAEWEYACRAGSTTAFHTGDTITTDQANFDGVEATLFNPAGICRNSITPSKLFPPNRWGLYDMHGNQAEYCQDVCFREYSVEEVTDPVAAGSEGARVLRGGKSTSKAYYLRSGYRYGYTPGVGYAFRVVMDAPAGE